MCHVPRRLSSSRKINGDWARDGATQSQRKSGRSRYDTAGEPATCHPEILHCSVMTVLSLTLLGADGGDWWAISASFGFTGAAIGSVVFPFPALLTPTRGVQRFGWKDAKPNFCAARQDSGTRRAARRRHYRPSDGSFETRYAARNKKQLFPAA